MFYFSIPENYFLQQNWMTCRKVQLNIIQFLVKWLHNCKHENLSHFNRHHHPRFYPSNLNTAYLLFSQGLADSTIIARVNNELWDLDRPLEGDCKLELLRWDNTDAQAVFWHSSAHMLGEAMERVSYTNNNKSLFSSSLSISIFLVNITQKPSGQYGLFVYYWIMDPILE